MRLLPLLALAMSLGAQGPEVLVAALGDPDPIAAERAFRRLWLLPRDQVPAASLAAACSGTGAVAACALLRRHGLPLPAAASGVASLPALDDAGLRARLRDRSLDGATMAGIVGQLQQRGALDVETMLVALTSEQPTVAAVAVAILRHEWLRLPAELLVGIRKDLPATELVLRALAMAPRPAATAWVEACAADTALPVDVRCQALAAIGRPLIRADLALLVAALRTEQAGDGYALAAALLPANVADGAVATVVELLQARTPVGRLLPIIDRMSPGGHNELLVASAPLAADVRDDLCRHLAALDASGYAARARAALDGELPLEAAWLLRAGPLLDRPERIARVVAAMRDADADPALRLRAFDALVDARVWDDAMAAFAQADPVARYRRLLAGDPSAVPEEVLAAALDRDEVRTFALQALHRRPLTPSLEERVQGLVTRVDGRRDTPAVRAAAIALLALHGGETAVTAMWAAARVDPAIALHAAEHLSRRRAPFVHALLLAELARDPATIPTAEQAFRDQVLDHVRVGLIELGDRLQLQDLVAHAGQHQPAFLRRCRHAAPQLSVAQARSLLAAMATHADEEVRTELASWAGGCADPEITAALLELWERSPSEELQAAALRGVLAGTGRAAMVARLRAAIASRQVDERLLAVAWEAIATTAEPLRADDAALLAELFTRLPLAAPDDDLRRARQFPEGRTGFPMVAAIAERLRHDADGLAPAAFAAAATALLADPDVALLARQRLLCLWTALVAVPAQQQAIGMATAALLPAIPDADDRGGGVAALWLAAVAERRGEFAAAAAHARAAIAGLLRGAEDGLSVRVFVGERDPAGGVDPCAALAARPWLCDARAALATGDRDAARRALATAAGLAGRDAATLASIRTLTVESSK